MIYTAVFSSAGTAATLDGDGIQSDKGDDHLSVEKDNAGSPFNWLWIVIPSVLILLAAGAYFGIRTVKRRNDNKWEDEEE